MFAPRTAFATVCENMTLPEIGTGTQHIGRYILIAGCALSLAGCAGMNMDEDSVVGSRLAQPPKGQPLPKAEEVGDITIAGQNFSHAIMDLPAVSGATVPPLVRFNGVTSIIMPPIDTEPYTELLRDRILLLTREKLRFFEHTLPPYIPGKKHRSEDKQPVQNTSDPDFEILAEMRGHAEADMYRIQIEFVDAHSHEVLYNGLYHIRPEAGEQQNAPESANAPEPSENNPPPPLQDDRPPVPQAVPDSNVAQPTTREPSANAPL
jgi:hypothetical protein